MRYELRDYQRDAALEVLKRVRRGRRDWREDGERSSFALSAITGSRPGERSQISGDGVEHRPTPLDVSWGLECNGRARAQIRRESKGSHLRAGDLPSAQLKRTGRGPAPSAHRVGLEDRSARPRCRQGGPARPLIDGRLWLAWAGSYRGRSRAPAGLSATGPIAKITSP